MGYEVAKSGDPYIGRRMFGGDNHLSKSTYVCDGLKGNVNSSSKHSLCKDMCGGKRQSWFHRNLRSIGFTIGVMGLIFWIDSLLFPEFDSVNLYSSFVSETRKKDDGGLPPSKNESSCVLMYGRLLNLASASLAEKEFRDHQSSPWKESSLKSSAWKPCADRKSSENLASHESSNGYIIVSANGGLNQQRVAVCNAVAVASFLNATLVLPRFLYSTVWKDPSQFGDIYQEEHFISTMKDDIAIVKDLPPHLKSLDLEAIGSVITDADLVKEAKPADFTRLALPILLQNGVVHFLGFGNRLGFDPLPPHLQKLRCKCNFHALKFTPKIQEVGSLLVKRIRKYGFLRNKLDKELLGEFLADDHIRKHEVDERTSKYLALHLRFEIDMVAYSLCEFGGGHSEKKELQTYREIHFPLLLKRLKKLQPASPEELRMSGRCPLTPEETALLLSGLGVKRGTYIYLASSQLYGGRSRMMPFTNLYPNLVTKEDLLSPSELEPFRNFSSQLAALDFIACATADVFAMTDTGSQLSSLVSGFRTYFGGGNAPILRPNKKRLAAILSKSGTIGWDSFRDRLKKMIEEDQRVHVRRYGQSIYRLPRSPECMCKAR